MREISERFIQAQNHGQVQIVLTFGQGLHLKTRTIEGGKWHKNVNS
jgi:hypothetical protein